MEMEIIESVPYRISFSNKCYILQYINRSFYFTENNLKNYSFVFLFINLNAFNKWYDEEKPYVFYLLSFGFYSIKLSDAHNLAFLYYMELMLECISHYMIMSFHPLKYEDHFSLRMKDIFQAKWKNTVSSENIKSK